MTRCAYIEIAWGATRVSQFRATLDMMNELWCRFSFFFFLQSPVVIILILLQDFFVSSKSEQEKKITVVSWPEGVCGYRYIYTYAYTYIYEEGVSLARSMPIQPTQQHLGAACATADFCLISEYIAVPFFFCHFYNTFCARDDQTSHIFFFSSLNMYRALNALHWPKARLFKQRLNSNSYTAFISRLKIDESSMQVNMPAARISIELSAPKLPRIKFPGIYIDIQALVRARDNQSRNRRKSSAELTHLARFISSRR